MASLQAGNGGLLVTTYLAASASAYDSGHSTSSFDEIEFNALIQRAGGQFAGRGWTTAVAAQSVSAGLDDPGPGTAISIGGTAAYTIQYSSLARNQAGDLFDADARCVGA